jgi:hypothetical protein
MSNLIIVGNYEVLIWNQLIGVVVVLNVFMPFFEGPMAQDKHRVITKVHPWVYPLWLICYTGSQKFSNKTNL